MKISDFLSADYVMNDVVAATKKKLLTELSRNAAVAADVLPEYLLAELLKREGLGSTGVGGGVAIPHARLHPVTRPFGILARLRRPLDFESVDGKPVDLVFLLLLPRDAIAADQLGALASISRTLRNPEIAMALRGAHDAGEMYRVLTTD